MKKKSNGQNLYSVQVPFHPWIYFVIFLVSNSLLSYFPLSLVFKLSVGTLGVVLPLVLALLTVLEKRLKKIHPLPLFSFHGLSKLYPGIAPPFWLWLLFGFLLLFTRFYRLTSLPFWPLSDEGLFSSMAMDMMKKWRWDISWGGINFEPLTIWGLGFFFKLLSPSLLSLRLFPTLVSLATAGLSYWAIRRFFEKNFSFIFACLFSFSFWEFSLMRFCCPESLIPLFEFLALGLLGFFLHGRTDSVKMFFLLILSLVTGLGFYTYINWTVVWICLFSILVMAARNGEKGNWKYPAVFFVLTFILALPWLAERLSPGHLSYIQGIYSNPFSPRSFFQYLTCLFGDSRESFPFGPDWGGMFDPVTGSLILIGTVYLVENLGIIPLTFFGLGLFITILPGTVTNYVELHRITPSLPFWVLLGTYGIQSLFPAGFKTSGRYGISFLLVVIVALNSYNFAGPYDEIQRAAPIRQWRNVQYAHAYEILKKWSENRQKPVDIFLEFNTDYDNKTLNTACYPFNAAQNPTLSAAQPQWAAIVTNAMYTPYFIHQFPSVQYETLKSDKSGPNDPPPFRVFLIPLSQIPAEMLQHWIQLDRFYWELDLAINNNTSHHSWSEFSKKLELIQNSFPRDLFLTAIYWEKKAFLNFLSKDFQAAAQDYENAVRKGFPAAHLYYDLGVSLEFQEKKKEAEKAFKKANELSVMP